MEIQFWPCKGKLARKGVSHPRKTAKTPTPVRHGSRLRSRSSSSLLENSLQNQGKRTSRLKLSRSHLAEITGAIFTFHYIFNFPVATPQANFNSTSLAVSRYTVFNIRRNFAFQNYLSPRSLLSFALPSLCPSQVIIARRFTSSFYCKSSFVMEHGYPVNLFAELARITSTRP